MEASVREQAHDRSVKLHIQRIFEGFFFIVLRANLCMCHCSIGMISVLFHFDCVLKIVFQSPFVICY